MQRFHADTSMACGTHVPLIRADKLPSCIFAGGWTRTGATCHRWRAWQQLPRTRQLEALWCHLGRGSLASDLGQIRLMSPCR